MDDSWIGKRVAAVAWPGKVFVVEAIYPGTLAMAVRDEQAMVDAGSSEQFPDVMLYAGEYWRVDAEPEDMGFQEAHALRDRAVAELRGDGNA